MVKENGFRVFVGAMKIARNVAAFGRWGEWYSRSHSTGYSQNRRGTGDFHRPYETQKILRFTIHRGFAGSEGDGVFGQLMPGEVGDKLLGGGGGVLVDEAGGEGQVAGDFRRGFALSQLP